jgi:hypothetical protein
METGDRTARSAARLILGTRVFAQCFVVLVIVGIAAGWFRPYRHEAKRVSNRHATGAANSSSTSTSPQAPPPSVDSGPLQSWRITNRASDQYSLEVRLKIEPSDISTTPNCEGELSDALRTLGKLRIDRQVYHDATAKVPETAILRANHELVVPPSCRVDKPVPRLGVITWDVDTDSPGSPSTTSPEVHLVRRASIALPPGVKCKVGRYVWIPAAEEPSDVKPDELEFTRDDDPRETGEPLAQACG